jgi:hypothetical protein
MKAHHLTAFEQMIGAMRQRLRPTKANLFADQLRIYVGLNCAEPNENRLLKMLLLEVSLSLGTRAQADNAMGIDSKVHYRNPGADEGDAEDRQNINVNAFRPMRIVVSDGPSAADYGVR